MRKEIHAFWDCLKKLLYVMNKQQKKNSIFVLLLVIVGSFLDLLGVSVMLPFVYVLLDIDRLKTNKYFRPILESLNIQSNVAITVLLISVIVLIYLFKNICLLYIKYRQEKFSCGYKKEVSMRMLSAIMKQPYQYFININLAEILRGVFNDVEGSYNMLSTLFRIMSSFFGIFVVGIYLLQTDAFITVGLFTTALLCVMIIFVVVKGKIKTLGYKQREFSTLAYKSVSQAINGVKEILVMKRQKKFIDDYDKAYEEKRIIDIAYGCILDIPSKVIETFFISGLVIVVGIRAVTLGNGDSVEFVANMAVFAVGAIKLMPYLSRISADITNLIYQRPNVLGVYNVLQSVDSQEEEAINDKMDKLVFNENLAIENISWRYAGAGQNVIHNLTLKIKRGESIGIIGESGVGKSTLMDIILGLFHPQEGDVCVDGISIYDNPYGWAKLVGYVPQTIYLLDDTIRNNILFGAERDDDTKIWEALEQAQLKSFVEESPMQLDTIVGERGVKMSGGQRQRLAIARTLYYNPEILVLDEATSALDSETEEALMECIESLQGTKTLIIVAHRLTTIANCDRVFEVQNGRVIERNKKELLHGKDDV